MKSKDKFNMEPLTDLISSCWFVIIVTNENEFIHLELSLR